MPFPQKTFTPFLYASPEPLFFTAELASQRGSVTEPSLESAHHNATIALTRINGSWYSGPLSDQCPLAGSVEPPLNHTDRRRPGTAQNVRTTLDIV